MQQPNWWRLVRNLFGRRMQGAVLSRGVDHLRRHAIMRTTAMRTTALLLLSSLVIAPLAGCIQSDEEYFRQVERSGISQQQRDRQSLRSSYGPDDFRREQEEAEWER